MVYADGSRFIGQFIDSIPNGHGTHTLVNGDVYSGIFSGGLLNGMGNVYYKNGQLYTGLFKDGQPVNQISRL